MEEEGKKARLGLAIMLLTLVCLQRLLAAEQKQLVLAILQSLSHRVERGLQVLHGFVEAEKHCKRGIRNHFHGISCICWK